MREIILASASVARAALLAAARVRFRREPARLDEADLQRRLEAQGTSAPGLAVSLATAKAMSLAAPRAVVIGADQTLSVDETSLHKAADLEAARSRLRALRGRSHQLHAAVALVRDGEMVWSHLVTATLRMRPFSDEFLDAYIERHGQSLLGSVGCYRLEDDGAQLFESVEGDYFSILGLPLLPLLGALREAGALAT